MLNSTRHIPNARNAIIDDDAKRALVTCANRNLPDRSRGFCPIGSSVQIASRIQWVGCFRVAGHSSSNRIIEKGKKVAKWPKYKTRLISARPEDGLGRVAPPEQPASESDEENTSELETHIHKRHPRGWGQSSDSEARPVQSDGDPVGIIDGDFEVGDDHFVYFSDRNMWPFDHQFPTSTFAVQGIITCPEHHGSNLALTLRQMLPAATNHVRQKPEPRA